MALQTQSPRRNLSWGVREGLKDAKVPDLLQALAELAADEKASAQTIKAKAAPPVLPRAPPGTNTRPQFRSNAKQSVQIQTGPSRGAVSAMLIECVEVALLKLSNEPSWRMAGSGFLDRTLGTLAEGVRVQIQANKTRQLELMQTSEDMQQVLQDRQTCLAEMKRRRRAQESCFSHQAYLLSRELRQEEEQHALEKVQLGLTKARHKELEAAAVEELDIAREEERVRRAELTLLRENLAARQEQLRATYEEQTLKLDYLTKEITKAERELKITALEVERLPEDELQVEQQQAKRQSLQQQVREIQSASLPKRRTFKSTNTRQTLRL